MRSGKWRGVTLALGMALVLGLTTGAKAQHAIPRLVPAVTFDTGEPYYAPPIPYGHYAGKNLDSKLMGHVAGLKGGLLGKLHGLGGIAHGCGVPGCSGTGAGGGPCGHGAGMGHGKGLGHGHGGAACADGNCSPVMPTSMNCGIGGCSPIASGQGSPVVSYSMPSDVMPASACGAPGCSMPVGKHRHMGCGSCGGKGCGGCGVSDPCGSCGGKGCGACGMTGKACGALGHLAGAGAKAHGLIGGLLGAGNIKWFTGPGGPVPLTPGYTPYVITTRSPRDFFAFPPMTPDR